jgi:AAA domain
VEVTLGISYSEVVATLLKGEPLTWSKFDDQKAGTITLETAQKRHLFKFLLGQNSSILKQPTEPVFKGLIESWVAAGDPAHDAELGATADTADSWRLTKIEASGIGGLTSFSGRVFELEIGGENWCLEGQNGSGKSSLANAILWALTGKRFREKDGLIEDLGVREPVLNSTGKSIGTWPPLAAYPAKITDLASSAKVWVKLTFSNQAGNIATAFREMNSPVVGNATITKKIDPRIVAVPQLVEIGLVMPARIPTVGFGEKSGSLYEAVKQLTGLDHLADIAEATRLLTHGAQAFLKYAKNAGVDTQEFKFSDAMAKASKNAAALGIDISTIKKLGQTDLGKTLKSLSDESSIKAAELLSSIKDQIAFGLVTEKSDVRIKIKQAIVDAGGVFAQGAKGSATFAAWAAMGNAYKDPLVVGLPSVLAEVKASLEIALSWNVRQAKDQKLRLKAVAAQYYVEDSDGGICPLCLARLATAEQIALQAELEELKVHADVAERKLGDACATIEKRLAAALPQGLASYRAILSTMNPKSAYAKTVRELFVSDEPFKSLLVGIAKRAEEVLAVQLGRVVI